MQRFQSKKIYDPTTGDVLNSYDPHQMMESYFFPKSNDNAGSTVTTLQSGMNLGELTDLNYFYDKLYKALKIPHARFDIKMDTQNKGDVITHEENRFNKFIVRIQKRFSMAIKKSFTTHLKLRGLWDKYKMNERCFDVLFVPPIGYEIAQSQKLFDMKIKNYDNITSHTEFSKELAMKKYLGMSDSEIIQNNNRLLQEAVKEAFIQKKVENIKAFEIPNDIGANSAGQFQFQNQPPPQ
jgi:hypothetical protein